MWLGIVISGSNRPTLSASPTPSNRPTRFGWKTLARRKTGAGWHDSLTTSGAGAFRWLSGRTRAETTFALELVHGAPTLRLEGSTDAVAQGSGGKSQESLRESFERLLRQLELPTLALADPEISKNVLARISHRHRHEVP